MLLDGGGGWRAFATAAATDAAGEGSLLPLLFLRFAASRAEAALPRAERALEEDWRERVGVPLTSLSSSDMGSLDTNSFCSNWTTTYGRAWMVRTLRARAWMSLM